MIWLYGTTIADVGVVLCVCLRLSILEQLHWVQLLLHFTALLSLLFPDNARPPSARTQ